MSGFVVFGVTADELLDAFRGHSGITTASTEDMFADMMGDQRKVLSLNAQNEATFTFLVPFDQKPTISHIYEEEADGLPVIIKVKSFVMANGKFAGVTIKGFRFQNLPVLNNVSGVLTAVVDGVNAGFSALSGKTLFGGSLEGMKVHIEAARPIVVP